MKFAHISDLHLGIRLYERKMINDQMYILDQIVDILASKKPDAVLISGDIYDRPVPPEEAVDLLNCFLTRINEMGIRIYITSGNHDSPERLSFGNSMLEKANVYVQAVYDGSLKKVRTEDEYGPINVYMLPFIKPSYVNNYLEEKDKVGGDYDLAVQAAVKTAVIDKNERNIIMAHQFVQGATRMESEEIIVGFVDSISADIFNDFDYVALGHLHKRQRIKRDTLMYSGSPIKYSFSETNNTKSVTFIDVKEKGNIEISEERLIPLHDMKVLKGTFEDLMLGQSDDYIKVVLTNESPVIYAYNKLRQKYPNILTLEYSRRSPVGEKIKASTIRDEKRPIEIFETFFRMQTGKMMDADQKAFAEDVINRVMGEEI